MENSAEAEEEKHNMEHTNYYYGRKHQELTRVEFSTGKSLIKSYEGQHRNGGGVSKDRFQEAAI